MRRATSPFLFLRFFSAVVCPGITPFLPNIANRPAGPAVAGFFVDLPHKWILYEFGFTLNYVPYHKKRILVLRFIVMAGSSVQVQNTCIPHCRALREKSLMNSVIPLQN
ncbi:hypothetical protein Q9Z39_004156 [Enterobacter hormaechei]